MIFLVQESLVSFVLDPPFPIHWLSEVMGDINLVERFHKFHNTDDWRNFQAVGKEGESFLDFLRRIPLQGNPNEGVVSYTAAVALKLNVDFDPLDDNLETFKVDVEPEAEPSQNDGKKWPAKVNDLYLTMVRTDRGASHFSRVELFEVLRWILTVSDSTPEQIRGIQDGLATSSNAGVLQLIRDLTKE